MNDFVTGIQLQTMSLTIPDPSVEALRVRVQESISDEVRVEQILVSPWLLSAYIPPPDTVQIDLSRPVPQGRFDIIVRHNTAMLTQRASDGGESVASVLVPNAATLAPFATYIILTAGGELTEEPVLYEPPEWLIRQVEPRA